MSHAGTLYWNMDVHGQLLIQIADTLRGMELLPADKIVVRRKPWTGDIIHPGITVHPTVEREAPGTNEREDIGYGVQITDVVPVDASLRENVEKLLDRRAKIRRKFIHGRLDINLQGNHYNQTKLEHGTLQNTPRGIENYEVSTLVLRCWVRESRDH